MPKEEFLKELGFYGRTKTWRERGARLTTAQEELLGEAAWQAFRKVREHKKPKPMTPAQRALKLDLLASWRADLESLRFVEDAFPFGKDQEQTAWFREKDLRRVLDKEAVLRIVQMCVSHFGTEYADAILDALRTTYDMQGEQIVLQRVLGGWGGFPVR